MYLRRSTDRQEQSVDDQRKALVRFAEERELSVVREYLDDAVSGVMTDDRKAFLRMIDDAQRKPRAFDVIVVFDVSRFGRVGQDEAGYYRHLLSKAGVEVLYAAEGFVGDETDELMRPMKQFMAHKMVRDLSKLTMRGARSRAEKGRWCGGRAPYGYDVAYYDAQDREYQRVRMLDNGDREIRGPDGKLIRVVPRGVELGATSSDKSLLVPGDPTRIEIVRKIFGWYVTGTVGYGAIAARLNAMGVLSPGLPRKESQGRGWSQLTIREILRNPAYRGALAWNKRTFGKFYRWTKGGSEARPTHEMNKPSPNAEQDWIVREHQHEALITTELWYAARRAMELRGGVTEENKGRRQMNNSAYLLSGLVSCARCGRRYQGYRIAKGRKKASDKAISTFYYCCGGYVHYGNAVCRRTLLVKDEVEDSLITEVIEHIRSYLADGGAALLERMMGAEMKPKADRAALEARMVEAKKKLDDAVACLTPALASVLEPRIIELQREVETTRRALEELDHLATNERDLRQFVDDLLADLRRIESTIRTMPFLEKREIVRAITSGIVFDPNTGDAHVHFHAIPRGLGVNEKRPELAALASSARSIAGEGFEPPTSGL